MVFGHDMINDFVHCHTVLLLGTPLVIGDDIDDDNNICLIFLLKSRAETCLENPFKHLILFLSPPIFGFSTEPRTTRTREPILCTTTFKHHYSC